MCFHWTFSWIFHVMFSLFFSLCCTCIWNKYCLSHLPIEILPILQDSTERFSYARNIYFFLLKTLHIPHISHVVYFIMFFTTLYAICLKDISFNFACVYYFDGCFMLLKIVRCLRGLAISPFFWDVSDSTWDIAEDICCFILFGIPSNTNYPSPPVNIFLVTYYYNMCIS